MTHHMVLAAVAAMIASPLLAETDLTSSSSAPEGTQGVKLNFGTEFSSVGEVDYRDLYVSAEFNYDLTAMLGLQAELGYAYSQADGPLGSNDWSAIDGLVALQYRIQPNLSFGPSLSFYRPDGADETYVDYGLHALYRPDEASELEVGLWKGDDSDGLYAYAAYDRAWTPSLDIHAFLGHYFDGDDSIDADYSQYGASATYQLGNGVDVYAGIFGWANSADCFHDVTLGAGYDIGRGADVRLAATYDIDNEQTSIFLGGSIDIGEAGGLTPGSRIGLRGLDFGDDQFSQRVGVRRSF